MTAISIRSTSARLSREFSGLKDAVLREMLAHRLEPDVMCCLRDMLQEPETIIHEEIVHGLDAIADRAEAAREAPAVRSEAEQWQSVSMWNAGVRV